MQFFLVKQPDYPVEVFVQAPSPRLAQIHAVFVMTVMRGEAAWSSPITLQVVPVERVAPPWFPHEYFGNLETTIRAMQSPPPRTNEAGSMRMSA